MKRIVDIVQWPGGVDSDPDVDFIRYVYRAPGEGPPEDVFSPVHPATESPT
jgi:hypothetical protein